MRTVGALLVVIAGCSVTLADPAGRACDDLHPCRDGRVCAAGICAAPSSSTPAPADAGDEACGDAGRCAEGTHCEEGACVGCTYVVSPSGSDTAAGTDEAPFKSLARLADALGPGVVGCLHTGTYAADVSVTRGGSAGAPSVLRSFPGERAKLNGRLIVAKTASFVTLARLDIDGTNGIGDSSPVVLATDITIEDCDLSSRNKDGCLRLGDPVDGDASRALVRRNRIHDCGIAKTNSASGVKVTHGRGIRIEDNTIYDNKDHGILFYPLGQDSIATGNVIDGNGRSVVFGGTDQDVASGNVVERNLLTFPTEPENVSSYYPGAVGQGNVVRNNCLFGGDESGGVPASPVGFVASDNTVADPRYVDRSKKDYRLEEGSACAPFLAGR